MELLLELRKKMFSDGIISKENVAELRNAVLSEGVMTKEKGDFLFEIKNTISIDRQSDEFRALFVDAITSLLLEDDSALMKLMIQRQNCFEQKCRQWV